MTLPQNSPPQPEAAPPHADAVDRAARALREGRYGEADGICRDILRMAPDHALALGIRGTAAALEGHAAIALELLERACSVDPLHAGWQSTLAELYRMGNRLDDALARASRAVSLQPGHVNALINLAKVRVDLGEGETAVSVFLAALALEPDNPEAHLGIGQVLLARGEFRPGWIEYEWRNKLSQARGRLPPVRAPQWNGMRLANGRILLIGDQGFGDALQFARYIALVAERCADVVLACSLELLPLLREMPGIKAAYHEWQNVPGFATYALLSSLPYLFGTEVATIPSGRYISADPARVAVWRSRLAATGSRDRRVGLFWAGRPSHPNDPRRSIPLATLQPLLGVPGVTLVSLQKAVPARDAAALAAAPILDFAEHLTDFGETAALIQNLDLVVTVDSAVGHLAGAMERPVWLLTAAPADWRWLLDRSDTPWYGSMRLFRQERPGLWEGVVESVARDLALFAEARA